MKTEENKNTGSVFMNWHSKIFYIYFEVVAPSMEKLNRLPSSEWLITEGDVADLLELAELFEVEIPEDADLFDMLTFKYFLGKIKKKAKDIIVKDLKPVDPYAQLVNLFKEEDIRQLEGEKA